MATLTRGLAHAGRLACAGAMASCGPMLNDAHTTPVFLMGRGDRRTRRGKIFRGSYGKCRPRKRKGTLSQAPPSSERVAVPEPPPNKGTPEEFAPSGGGIVMDAEDAPK